MYRADLTKITPSTARTVLQYRADPDSQERIGAFTYHLLRALGHVHPVTEARMAQVFPDEVGAMYLAKNHNHGRDILQHIANGTLPQGPFDSDPQKVLELLRALGWKTCRVESEPTVPGLELFADDDVKGLCWVGADDEGDEIAWMHQVRGDLELFGYYTILSEREYTPGQSCWVVNVFAPVPSTR